MRARRLPGLPALLLGVVAACGGTAGEAGGDGAGGKADDTAVSCEGARLDGNGVCRYADGRFAPKICCSGSPLVRLSILLQGSGVVVMPPPGVELGANEMTAEVRIVTVADPDRLGDLVGPLATEVAAEVDGEEGDLLEIFQHPDNHFELRGGFLDQEVRDALLADIAAERRAEVEAALDAVPAWYGAHLETYDVGSEIVGRDLFVIAPFGGGEALVLVVRYVHS